MKSVIIKNIRIQFDSFGNDIDNQTVINTLWKFQDELQQQYPDLCPQIFINAIDDDDIEIADEDVDEDVDDEKNKLINRILSNCYIGEYKKIQTSYRPYLETLSNEKLKDMWDEWENSQH